jgi:signal transduction histidine kinase
MQGRCLEHAVAGCAPEAMQAESDIQNGKAAAVAPRYSAGPGEDAVPATPSEVWDGLPLIARLAGLYGRLRAADRLRPWIADTALVLVIVALFCIPDLLTRDTGPRAVTMAPGSAGLAETLLLQAGLVLPLLWRRRAPVMVFALVTGAFIVQWSAEVWLQADVATLIALYSLVRHAPLRYLPWAFAAAAGSLAMVAVHTSSHVSIWYALFFLYSTIVAAAALGLAVRIRQAQLAGLRERAASLEIERDQRSRLATAAERSRMAREMHDFVGHNLSVIVTLADAGAFAAETAPERSTEALRLISDTGRQALGELRRTLGVLRDQSAAAELSPQPGIADIGQLCARARTAGPGIAYREHGDVEGLDRGLQLTIYRIVQEALTNSLKHAGPGSRVEVTVSAAGRRSSVQVQDSGPPAGARPPEPAGEAGHGLAGIRERVALYGGDVAAGPAPSGGWLVRAEFDRALSAQAVSVAP